MQAMHTLKNHANLEIETPHGIVAGGSQLWYSDKWQRTSGCGPTAAANQIWYLSRSCPALSGLINIQDKSQSAFLALQEEMFGYITPGLGGVNTSRIFADGFRAYAKAHEAPLAPVALDISRFKRPSWQTAQTFIAAGLDADCPVAFLNLSHGNQSLLDSWHWVTIVSLEDTKVNVSDQGRIFELDFKEWLGSTMLGGALVYLNKSLL